MYNIQNFKSVEDFKEAGSDTGVDHYAESISEKKTIRYQLIKPGSPVYIQTKGTINSKKEFKTNDGSRIPNFMMNAQSQAISQGHAYSARYVLFTTGKGLHYVLNNNSGQKIEVINYAKISKLVDNNVMFWNTLRSKMGIEEQEYSAPI